MEYVKLSFNLSLVVFQVYVVSQFMLGTLILFFVHVIKLCQRAAYVPGMQKFPMQLSFTAIVSRADSIGSFTCIQQQNKVQWFFQYKHFESCLIFSSVQALCFGAFFFLFLFFFSFGHNVNSANIKWQHCTWAE